MNIPYIVLRPDYARFRRGAPLKRNLAIIDQSDALLVIWDGKKESRGTIYTACHALKANKRVFLILATGEAIQRCVGEIKDESIFGGSLLNTD